MTKFLMLILIGLLMMVVITGCSQPTPIIILVTPTPEETFVLPEPDLLPTSDIEVVVTEDVPPGPTVTFIGPIVGQGYAPPSTETPIPSVTPLASATDVPLPTDVSSPTRVSPTDAPTPSGTAIAALDATNLGIQTIHNLEQDQWNEVMNQVDNNLQLGWVKVQINWDYFQPNGPGEITQDLRRIEIFIEQIQQARRVKVLLSVAKAPDWARTDLTEDGPPDDPQQLANFITLMLNEFGQAVNAVEVWNEPNLVREWRGQPLNGAAYMRYFEPSYNAIRAYSPDITVVTAGLAPTTNLDGSRDDREYLREMYNAGLTRFTDIGVGVHPYGWANPPDARCCSPSGRGWDEVPQFFFLDTLSDYRDIMVSVGQQNNQLWVTEFGWASWEGLPGDPPDPWMGFNSKWDQANYGLRAIEIMQGLDYIGPMFLWNLNFAQPALIDSRDERVGYSIVLPEGAPRERPMYWMLYDAVRPDEQLPRYD